MNNAPIEMHKSFSGTVALKLVEKQPAFTESLTRVSMASCCTQGVVTRQGGQTTLSGFCDSIAFGDRQARILPVTR